ncbi:hypothetical protein KFK09_029372 [Dendrobium nobile]|uniref:Uncharacterized protein n=1 Tax=Dendrobium nobile TaxID=94219 RepID=A0A8T3A0T5_DENNO|nr:hypothetical protein KFK09_029372 [Dendrobium nobile]
MCKCRSHGTFPPFGLQSSHLNICYYHQDPHRRPLRTGSRPEFYSGRRALLLIWAWPLPRWPGVGHALKRHPFSGLVDSADERFARQYRCGPPPEFPLASPRSGIVHHLSGPDTHAHTRTLHKRSGSVGGAPVKRGSRTSASLRPPGFNTRRLAHMSGSLVRVSRRVEWGAHGPLPRARKSPKSSPYWRVLCWPTAPTVPPRASIARAPAVGKACNDQRLEPSSEQATAIPLQAETHRRPPSASLRQFQALFDSLFKPWTKFIARLGLHSQTTRLADNASCCDRVRAERGSHPPGAPFQGTWARSVAEDASPDYNSSCYMAARFQYWAYPGSLAVTRGILVSFFSSAY